MRIVKFRGWDKKSKEMFYYVTLSDGSWSRTTIDDDWHSDGLMQYTGLKDKNGVDCFEGDIIRWNDTEIEAIIWNEQMASFTLSKTLIPHPDIKNALIPLGLLDNHKYEVIGNVYQNPELIKS